MVVNDQTVEKRARTDIFPGLKSKAYTAGCLFPNLHTKKIYSSIMVIKPIQCCLLVTCVEALNTNIL